VPYNSKEVFVHGPSKSFQLRIAATGATGLCHTTTRISAPGSPGGDPMISSTFLPFLLLTRAAKVLAEARYGRLRLSTLGISTSAKPQAAAFYANNAAK